MSLQANKFKWSKSINATWNSGKVAKNGSLVPQGGAGGADLRCMTRQSGRNPLFPVNSGKIGKQPIRAPW